jgi:hypothetical protein
VNFPLAVAGVKETFVVGLAYGKVLRVNENQYIGLVIGLVETETTLSQAAACTA